MPVFKAQKMPSMLLSHVNRLLQRPPLQRLPIQKPCLPAIIPANRSFATKSRLNGNQATKGPQETHKTLGNSTPSSQNPEYPSFSLKDLGANRACKIVVLVCLSVLGTMESIFWVKVGWAKFGPVGEEKREGVTKGE